jgi:sugar/nucleoside kinase (ribokinase family)
VTLADHRRVTMIGNANVDVIARPVTAPPDPGTEKRVDTIEMRVGGSAAISALTLAALGIPARLIACVGSDPLGKFVRDSLWVGGVPLDDVSVRSDERTAVSIAFEAPGHDRSFLIGLGCLAGFSEDLIPRQAVRADAVMITGYFLAPRLRGGPTGRLLHEAKRSGARTFLDTGWDPDGWPRSTSEEVAALLPSVDVFLPNLDEATAMTGLDEPQAAARALQMLSGGVVIVKLGSEGCVTVAPGSSVWTRAPAVDVVDSTGAGDAFNAGVIAGLIDDASLAEALELATRVGSSVVSRSSADRYPQRSELPEASTGGG